MPTHWHNLMVLMSTRAANDRTWAYFLPIYIAHCVTAASAASSPATATQPLSTAALLLAVKSFSTILLGPIFSSTWTPKRVIYYIVTENFSLVCSGFVLFHFDGKSLTPLCIASIFLAVESAASNTLTSNIQKHQTVLTSTSSVSLSKANAALVRLELLIAAAVPFFVGAVVLKCGYRFSVPVLIVMQLLAALFSLPTALGVAQEQQQQLQPSFASTRNIELPGIGGTPPKLAPPPSSPPPPPPPSMSFASLMDHVRPVFIIMMANAMLYFTVVSPSGMMLVYLQTKGLDSFYIASVSSLGQLFGMVGACITPSLIEKKGLRTAALLLLTCQTICVAGVAGLITVFGGDAQSDRMSSSIMLLVCCLIVGSRVGLWGIDLTCRQIIQIGTKNAGRVAVFGIGDAMAQCVSLCMYVALSSELLGFSTLTMASTLALFSSWFCVYVY